MSLWRMACDEVAGAWRSLRYDLRRRSDADARQAAGFPDTASNEVSTFGGPGTDPYSVHDEYARPPRRLVAVSAFGLLALVGAAGSYFTVLHGIGDLLAEDPPRSRPIPLVAEAVPAPLATMRQAPTARLGHGASIAPSPSPQAAPLRTKAAPAAATSVMRPRPHAEGGVAPRTVARPQTPCRCAPPAPIPTFPTGGPRPTGSPSAGSPSASPTPSTPPSPTASTGAPDDDDAGPTGPPRDHPAY
jgi:hypothetical protein